MPSTHPNPHLRCLPRAFLQLLAILGALLLTGSLFTSPAAAAPPLSVPVTAMSAQDDAAGMLIADPVTLPPGATSTRLDFDLPAECRLGDGGQVTCDNGLGEFAFTAMITTDAGFTAPEVTIADGQVEIITTAAPAGEGELLVPLFSPTGLDVDDTASKEMLAGLVLGNGTAPAPNTAEAAGSAPSLAPYAEAIERPEQVTVPSDYIRPGS